MTRHHEEGKLGNWTKKTKNMWKPLYKNEKPGHKIHGDWKSRDEKSWTTGPRATKNTGMVTVIHSKNDAKPSEIKLPQIFEVGI